MQFGCFFWLIRRKRTPDVFEACCRGCGQGRLKPVLSLGSTPLANALLAQADLAKPEDQWPLDLVRCEDCSLVQITETVPPKSLFSDYAYFSSFSDTMVAHAREVATRLIDERELGKNSLAIEVASNDGYLLQWYHQAGVPVLGIEPAKNIAEVAIRDRGVDTISCNPIHGGLQWISRDGFRMA